MNIFIITAGSRGDVQPFVALGRGLKEAGHTVTVCTCSRFESFVTGNGLTYGYLNDELMKLMDSEAGRKAMEEGGNIFGLMKTMITLLKQSKGITRNMLADAWNAARQAEPDILIFHPKSMAGTHIAEKLEIPAVMAIPVPIIYPTSEYPAIGFPRLKLGRWYNRLTYRIMHKGYHSYDSVINEFRMKTLELEKYPKSTTPIQTVQKRPIPVLHGHSEVLWPRPADWPEEAVVTGFWFLEQDEEWVPPPELAAFLASGDPPVLAGFGSMAGRNPGKTGRIVADAMRKARVRGIIVTGWGGMDSENLPESILKIEQAPFNWLFPRVSAVVHHGGAGTTAAGLRAGKPTVICPYIIDQPFWGERVHALGAGPEPIPQKKLTVNKLAAAIREAVTNSEMRRRAEEAGEKLRQEDGIARAVEIIEKVAYQGIPPSA